MKIADRKLRRQLDASVEGLFQERITRHQFIRRAMAWGVSAALLSDILVLHRKAFAADSPSREKSCLRSFVSENTASSAMQMRCPFFTLGHYEIRQVP